MYKFPYTFLIPDSDLSIKLYVLKRTISNSDLEKQESNKPTT